MMIRMLCIPGLLFICSSCAVDPPSNDQIEKWQQEVMQTEKDFAAMVKEQGIHDAFVAYAAENAVLMRNNTLIKGKELIDSLHKGVNTKGLSWEPDYIKVSNSGDLAYTYGHYTYSVTDSNGGLNESKGVFHTVWERQEDGTWKYVWD